MARAQLEAPELSADRPPRRRRRRNWAEALYPLALIVGVLVAWQVWVTAGDVPAYLWPSLPDVVRTLIESDLLRTAAVETVTLIVFGFALAVLVGLTLALLTVTVRPFEVGIFPLLVAKQFVPTVAIAPLFIIWWGFGRTPQLVVITLFGYFSVLITTLTGLRSVAPETIYLVQAMGAGKLKRFWKVLLPGALPSIFAGLRIAVTSCVIGAVIAEFIVGSQGLGYQILKAQGTGDSVTLVAGVVYLGVIGTIGFALVSLAERLAIPWHAGQRARTEPGAAG